MRRLRLVLRLAAVLLFLPVLSGCWDRKEINDVAFVLGSAVDREGKQYRATIQIALPGQMGGVGSKGGGGGTTGKKTWYLESKVGDTIRQANREEQRGTPRTLYFAHRRTFLIGEEMARDGIEPIMDITARVPQNRLSAFVMVTKGQASHIISRDAPMEQFPSEMLRELAASSMKTPRTLKHLLNLMLSEGIDPALPLVMAIEGADGGNPVKLGGLAVFRNNKMVGILKNEEAQGALWAMNEAKNPEVLVIPPEGSGHIVVQLQESRTELNPQVKGEEVTMNIRIRAKGSIMENESNYNLSGTDNVKAIDRLVGGKIEKEVLKAVDVLQHVHHADIIGFGKTLYTKTPNQWDTLSGQWEELYPKVKVTVEADIHIEHIGAVVKPFGRKDRNLVK